MTNLKDRLQKKIKSSKELPIPKTYFIIKNMAIWSFGGLFLLLGILGTMQIFFFAQNLEILEFLIYMPRLIPKIIFIGFPIIWIILAILGLFFAEKSIEKTKRGYRISKKILILSILGLQIILGGILSQTSFAEKTEKRLRNISHIFGNLDEQKKHLWQNPKQGFLVGKLIQKDNDKFWIIHDFDSQEWKLEIDNETKYPREKVFRKGESLRIRGKVLDEDKQIFKAQKIFLLHHCWSYGKK